MATRTRLMAWCTLLGLAATIGNPGESLGAGDKLTLAVVVSKSFPVDGISFGDLKRLYMGTPVNAGGKTLIPLTYPKQSSERLAFDEAVLGMGADEVGRYWIDRKIRGQSGPPKAVDSADVIIRVVSKVDGSIGYVRTDAVNQAVKILRVDGKLPKDPGYRVSH